jgi:hypothetical protein
MEGARMFSRIRYAAQVLSSSPVAPHENPDIAFEEEPSVAVSKLSRAIGGFLELFVVSVVIGFIAAPFLGNLWPVKTFSGANRVTAVIAAILALLVSQTFERVKIQLGSQLRIGERIAPYFGHKIAAAIRTLRS